MIVRCPRQADEEHLDAHVMETRIVHQSPVGGGEVKR
jgi:hypothetical protein